MKKLIEVVGGPRTLLAVPIVMLGIMALMAPVCASGFVETKLVADQPGVALFTDPNLVNAWGLVLGDDGVSWVADNHSGLVTTYGLDGTPLAVTFLVPGPAGSAPDFVASPTGLVANKSMGFPITDGIRTGRSQMIVASEDGTISGWNPFISPNAILGVDKSATGAVYKGLAIANNSLGTFIYATNFNAGTVETYDEDWNQVTTFPFFDPTIPAGYAPFGIRADGDVIFVTYAMQDALKHDDVAGPGHGFIDTFNTRGRLINRFASQGPLNSPWGIGPVLDITAHGPRPDHRSLLVGNFGDGRINLFNRNNGSAIGFLKDPIGNPIVIPGLWALASRHETGLFWSRDDEGFNIFFTAGPNGESNGLFGLLSQMELEPTQ